ncbi:MAG: O-antigen ligase family protein [Eubacteriaceae bacterium]
MIELGIVFTVISPYLAIIPILVIVYIVYSKNMLIYINPLNVGLLLMFVWSLFSGIINKSLFSAISSFAFVLFLGLCIYVQNNFYDEDKAVKLIYKIWKYSLFCAMAGVIEKIASYYVDMTWISHFFYSGTYVPTVENYRIYSTFGNPNIAGGWFAAMVLVSLYLFEKGIYKKKYTFLLSIGIFIFSLIFTGSKGATIGLEFAIFTYAIFRKNKKSRIVLFTLFSFVLILALISPEINHSLNSRGKIWEQSIEMFMQQPISGHGIFGIFMNINKVHAHNIWISIAAMLGIVGLSIYVWMKYYLFRSIIKLYQNNCELVPLLASFQALIIGHGLVDFTIMAPQIGILFFAFTGITSSLVRKYETYQAIEIRQIATFGKKLNLKKFL